MENKVCESAVDGWEEIRYADFIQQQQRQSALPRSVIGRVFIKWTLDHLKVLLGM